jgi:hypothetical protein
LFGVEEVVLLAVASVVVCIESEIKVAHVALGGIQGVAVSAAPNSDIAVLSDSFRNMALSECRNSHYH